MVDDDEFFPAEIGLAVNDTDRIEAVYVRYPGRVGYMHIDRDFVKHDPRGAWAALLKILESIKKAHLASKSRVCYNNHIPSKE